MDWGFLGEFWNAVTAKTINAWEYTADWFKQIGLAVAGAIGGLFDYLIHYMSDFFVFLAWIFSALAELVTAITYPMTYVGSFLRAFVANAISTPPEPEVSYTFATSTMEIFEAIPYWSVMSSVLGVCILVLGGVAIVLLITKI